MLPFMRGRTKFVLAALFLIAVFGIAYHREEVASRYAWLGTHQSEERSADEGGFETIELPKENVDKMVCTRRMCVRAVQFKHHDSPCAIFVLVNLPSECLATLSKSQK